LELSPNWEFVADTVMGGVSTGAISTGTVDGRKATRLAGSVSLDNNGGFVQMAFDLKRSGAVFDASDWAGIELDVYGNEESYDLRLRTDDLSRAWQSYRAAFRAPACWTTVRLPFAGFLPHRTDAPFDPAHLRRIGVLAIGRVFEADVAVSAVRFYR